MQLKIFEDISGENEVLQGKQDYSGMSANLYNQQPLNATTSLLDLLDTLLMFIREGATKDVKNIQQFYDPPRVFNAVAQNLTIGGQDSKKSEKLNLTSQSMEAPLHLPTAHCKMTY